MALSAFYDSYSLDCFALGVVGSSGGQLGQLGVHFVDLGTDDLCHRCLQ